MSEPTIGQLLDEYPPNTAIIEYQWPGEATIYRWAIGALRGRDTEQSLRDHLQAIKPGAIFLGYAIK